MSQVIMKLYHGTDEKAAKRIIKDGFICKENSEHWLGNGIYFYNDKSLARWWTTNPTNKFGIHIEKPAIIECTIKIEEERVLNLCTLDGYKNYVALFDDFFKTTFYEHRPDNELDFRKLRALFFNYILILNKVDMIVAPFFMPDQPYLPKQKNPYFEKMHILFTEVQICLKEDKQEYITEKRIIEVD